MKKKKKKSVIYSLSLSRLFGYIFFIQFKRQLVELWLSASIAKNFHHLTFK